MRKFKENLKNSKKLLRKICKNNWKFKISSQNNFKIFLKCFKKIWKQFEDISKIIGNKFLKILGKIEQNNKVNV